MATFRTTTNALFGSILGTGARILALAAVLMLGRATAATAAQNGPDRQPQKPKGQRFDRLTYIQVGNPDREGQTVLPRPE